LKCFGGFSHYQREQEKVAQENIHNVAEIRRFLLGEMPETERIAFEKRFIADESLFDQISVAEDELIESFVRGTLSPAEKTTFEREFLSTEPRRRRVAFLCAMLDKIKKENEIAAVKKTESASAAHSSVWASLANLFKTPKLAFGAAFAVLILIFGGWFLLRNSRQPEIVRQITPTPTAEIIDPIQNRNSTANQNNQLNPNANAAESFPDKKDDLPNANRPALNSNQNADKPKQNVAQSAPILALFAGTVRGEGKMPALNLPKNVAGANLQLNLESQDYKVYSIEIVNPDGGRIFKVNKLKARSSKINFFIPAAKLSSGDYIVKLSALNSNNKIESIADYSFRVNRK
jgi:hypothetical protein